MKGKIVLAAVALSLLAAPSMAADKIKIGFIATFSGGAAVLGKHMRDGFDLALADLGNKIGGLPVEVVYGDDQQKADVGRQVAEAMIKRDKVDFIVGVIWSNVAMAIQPLVVQSKTITVITNAGASPLAGKACSPYIFTTSWNNDQTPEAMGKLMVEDKAKNVFVMAPNYQAGKDMIAGFKRYYKDKVAGEILFPLGASDFQAELGQVRAAKPGALFVFAPGGMGVAFLKQWYASGLAKQFPLYSVFTVDETTFPAVGDAPIGSYTTSFWDSDAKFPANVRFVSEFKKKYGYDPAMYAAQSYDAPFLLDSGVKAVKGDLANKMGIIKAMEKANYESVRGPFKYNVNHVPIQNFYKREVIKGPDGKAMLHTTGIVFTDYKDAYYKDCKMKY
ncbi:MAG: ABC transporter substrate-binding protein [Candidatus Eiseniibacteriota bacterium]